MLWGLQKRTQDSWPTEKKKFSNLAQFFVKIFVFFYFFSESVKGGDSDLAHLFVTIFGFTLVSERSVKKFSVTIWHSFL